MQFTSSLIARGLTAAALASAVLCLPAFAASKHKHDQAAAVSTAPAKFSELDANKDGAISKIEAERNTGLKDAFATLDADKNGKLSATEFAKFSTPPAAVAAVSAANKTANKEAAKPVAKAAVVQKSPVAAKTVVTKPEAAKPEAAKPEAAKPEAAKPEAAKKAVSITKEPAKNVLKSAAVMNKEAVKKEVPKHDGVVAPAKS